jgi:hypothetical protein
MGRLELLGVGLVVALPALEPEAGHVVVVGENRLRDEHDFGCGTRRRGFGTTDESSSCASERQGPEETTWHRPIHSDADTSQ